MAKATGGNGKPKSKMAGVRQILAANPTATGSEISKLMKSQFGMSMNPKVAGTYRYHVQKAARRNQRKAVRAVAGAQAGSLEILCAPRTHTTYNATLG